MLKLSQHHSPNESEASNERWLGGLRRKISSLFGSDNVDIQSIKDEIDADDWSEKGWEQIRQGVGIQMNKIKTPSKILRALGEDRAIKYFKALEGKGKPYTFALPIDKKDLLEYLKFETDDAHAPFVISMLKKPLTAAGINILITHATWTPRFIDNIREEVGDERFKFILAQVSRDFPSATDAISYILLGEERRSLEEDARELWYKNIRGAEYDEKIEQRRVSDDNFFYGSNQIMENVVNQ